MVSALVELSSKIKSHAFYSAPQREKAANATQIRLSVRLSVTLRYCVKMRERKWMRSSSSGSPASVPGFLTPRILDGGRPCVGKI